ncbi:MAG: PAS domain-containing protein, partial [Burkholderiales bacterium]|nr:PAS domain-containing protein [Burkholderiales bacterium]
MFSHLDLADENIYKVIDLLNINIYWKDTQGHYLGCNSYMLNALDLKSRADLIGKDDYHILEKHQADKVVEIDQAVIEGNSYHNEEVVVLVNGKLKTFVTTKTPVVDANGITKGLLGISVDITSIRNQMEAEKHEIIANEEQKIRQIIDVVDASIYWKDKDGYMRGCNQHVLDIFGAKSREEILGKNEYDLVTEEQAINIREIDQLVLKNGSYRGEEIFNVAGGVEKVYFTVKNQLLDHKGNVIGIVGTSLDITAQKKSEQLRLDIEKHQVYAEEQEKFRQIIDLVDASIYWKDKDGHYLGCNKYVLNMAGVNSLDEILGKTDFDMLWKNEASKLREIDELVMTTTTRYEGEELISSNVYNKSKPSVVLTVKNPLLDNNGKVIGIVGTSLDITAQKEAEKLKLENEKHQTIAEQQERFRKIVGQMAHDIRSPLSTLRTLVQNNAKSLPEHDRTGLQRAAINIEDITNHMLSHYTPKESSLTENNQRQHVLVSMVLAEVASERRTEYKNRPIKFEVAVENPQINNFVFIQIEPSGLRRMLSNLINNAAQALPKKTGGKITLELRSNEELVTIAVSDNGKGIPLKKLQQLRQGMNIATTKKTGYGIGLTQVFDVIEGNYGTFEIDSAVGYGTTITIRFPKAVASQWLATKIELAPNDTIIIVDDDESIHHAWNSRIKYILEKFPDMSVKHFTDGEKALQFIATLPDKDSVLLLNDYELLNQELNGLQTIKQSGVKRSILVTSHYENHDIRTMANKQGVLILPKDLAHSIPFKVERPQHKPGELIDVHMVIVDDKYTVVDTLIADYYSHLIIDTYSNPYQFLNEVDKYPKHTRIIV